MTVDVGEDATIQVVVMLALVMEIDCTEWAPPWNWNTPDAPLFLFSTSAPFHCVYPNSKR